MTNHLEDEIRALVAHMDNQEQEQDTQNQPEDIQDVYVLIVRQQEEVADTAQVVDSTTIGTTQPAPITVLPDSFLSAYVFVCCAVFLIFTTLVFQSYCILNPPIATVTIMPTAQHVQLSGTMQLGRVLPPLTISQSQTTPATGHGHQNAAQARGYITLYNGQLTSIFVPAGTIFTGLSGVPITTDQAATIPAANLPQVGQVTVSAHAINAGSSGNIPAYDINQGCCATAIKAVNPYSFTGGQDERTYTTVTQHDIHSISTVLTTTLTRSITGALQGQLRPEEQLQLLPCHPLVSSDHQLGEEATQVTVTVAETCSAVAYNSQTLTDKVTAWLIIQANTSLGTGYSLLGAVRVTVKQASVSSTPHLQVFLSFQAQGIWIYGLSYTTQQQIKQLLAGKPKPAALQLLLSLPGIKQGSIQCHGFGDATRLPKNSSLIHIVVLYEPA